MFFHLSCRISGRHGDLDMKIDGGGRGGGGSKGVKLMLKMNIVAQDSPNPFRRYIVLVYYF